MASCNSAYINQQYIVGQDSSVGFDGPIIDMSNPTSSLNYQFKWAAGVRGILTWYASIFSDPYCWETLVSCEEVTITVDGSAPSSIVSLPGQWLTVGFLKFSWVPDGGGSSGDIDAAIRIVPL